MKIDRMGALIVMSHLIITLAILGIYAYTLFFGESRHNITNNFNRHYWLLVRFNGVNGY